MAGPRRKLEPVEVFDLRPDPREQDNLAGRGEAKETELQAWPEGMMRELKAGGRR
ncbi:MAG: hypothetical protein QGD90_02155 [Candidatus Hydrogenedentes bacterium]|nr:hypothetical protein [Candidatus Hydrogenedentota bacterium]